MTRDEPALLVVREREHREECPVDSGGMLDGSLPAARHYQARRQRSVRLCRGARAAHLQ